MRFRLKHALVALISIVLLAMAHSPLLRSGLLAGDLAVLLDPWRPGIKPLAALSIEASVWLWGLPLDPASQDVALALRLEHLLYLLLSGVGLGYFVRRLLLPWSGSEPSKAAGRAAALLFAVHPLVIGLVADVGARGQWLGLGFSIWAALLFLRGRQDQRFGWLSLAFLFAVAAGFSSWLALGLPILLASCDLTSTHRYRPLRTRLRTSASTLLLFSVAVLLESLLSLILRGSAGLEPLLSRASEVLDAGGLRELSGQLAKTLGLLVVPSNPQILGSVGILIAGAAFLLAMQPALQAARSAPRLWGWLLCGLAVALLASMLMSLGDPGATPDARRLACLLPAIAVMAAGLGLGSTALSGPHRPYMAWVIVIAYACLAHAHARPWMSASADVGQLRREMSDSLAAHPGLRTVVLDAPRGHRGLPVVREHIGVFLDARLNASKSSGLAQRPRAEALALATDEFLGLLDEPEFRAWLGQECLIIRPLGDGSSRPYSVLRPLGSSTGARTWLQTLGSPPLDISPLEDAALRVRVGQAANTVRELRVEWLTQPSSQSSSQLSSRGQVGLWRQAESGALGWFDLASSLDWRLAGRVRKLLFTEGLQSIQEASLMAALPSLGSPLVSLSGGSIGASGVQLPEGYGAGELRLSLLDLSVFRVQSLLLESSGSGHYSSAGLALEAERRLGAGHILGWVLEYSIQGSTIARERGRF